MPAHAFIGTNRWNYAAWRDDFYCGVPRASGGSNISMTTRKAMRCGTRLAEEILGRARQACDKSEFAAKRRALREARNPP